MFADIKEKQLQHELKPNLKRVQAFYFGELSKKYFALLFNPTVRTSSLGVLICKPIGQEDIRTNKAVIQLGREISNQGIVTMVFDYYGTGDSSGRFEDITLDTCIESITEAVACLKKQYRIDHIIILGLRAGTLFIHRLNKIIEPKAFILWHPVVNGSHFLREIRRQHRTWLMGSFVRKDGKFKDRTEILGFAYSDRFKRELSSISFDLKESTEGKKYLLVSNLKLVEGVEDRDMEFLQSRYNNFWVKNGSDDALVPIHDIKLISSWVITTDKQYL